LSKQEAPASSGGGSIHSDPQPAEEQKPLDVMSFDIYKEAGKGHRKQKREKV
jgi:hypothetical protein